MKCCPFLEHGHCLVAIHFRKCRDGGGTCVVTKDRCCGTVYNESLDIKIPEWEFCNLYKLGLKYDIKPNRPVVEKGVRREQGLDKYKTYW